MVNAPNPGSREALRRGCTCPVEVNLHGQGVRTGDTVRFYRNQECPLHGKAKPGRLTEWIERFPLRFGLAARMSQFERGRR